MNQDDVKQEVETLLAKLGFEGDVEVFEREGGFRVALWVNQDQSLLIGQNGANLAAFQHLVRLLLRHDEVSSTQNIYVDINNYWKEKEKKLMREAEEKAQEVLATGEEYTFAPMSAHDRRIIHQAVLAISQVQSESIGIGRERKVRLSKVAF